MPLHLLHHKSYHVYSTTNIERVRRDEAAARAKEEAEEQRMQEADAEHRMRVLRARAGGKATPPLEERREEPTISGRFVAPEGSVQTEGDGTVVVRQPTPPQSLAKHRKPSPKLIGSDGHINLFSDFEKPHPRKNVEKNAEYEAEKKAKEDKLEAQYTMGLGKPADELRPWYSTLDMVGEVKGRKKTEWEIKKDEKRKDWGDPLVAIKRGVRGVKDVEEERKEWKRSRELGVGGLGLGALNTERSSGVKRARSRSRSQEHRSRRDKSPSGHRSHDRERHRSRSRSVGGHHHSHRRSKRESSTGHTPHRHRRHQSLRSRASRHHSPHEDTMERLRRERDQREKDEREKAESMLKKEKEYRLPGWKAADGGRYSSQFGIGEVRKR